ncbi:protein kinase, ATP binding site-containing protein [Tanacetum coccineum]|uniref:Protein kinase, ATP binding site-containing protein n=1 Tax=Tanacetum coccineum TaxID=301880 RepID=A0ABQ5BJF5_9ASTR
MSSPSEVNLENLRFSRKEIDRAVHGGFKTGAVIKPDVCIYEGYISEPYHDVIMFPEVDIKSRWYSECNGTFKYGFLYSDELKILSRLHHENILPFIGYCDEKDVFLQEGVDDGDKVILVYEFGSWICRSLDVYLRQESKEYFSWAERLEICVGIAKGLNYLHSGVEEVGRVIHNDFQSKNIMLDTYYEPKIMGFYHSVIVPENQLHTQVNSHVRHQHNPDPIYHEIGLFDTTTDVYSYGILMFEMLMWMPANEEKMFIDIAYRCISFNLKDRPTMDEVAKTLTEALDIHLCPQRLGRSLRRGSKVNEEMRVLLLHLVFAFPGSSMKLSFSSMWISSNGIASGSLDKHFLRFET